MGAQQNILPYTIQSSVFKAWSIITKYCIYHYIHSAPTGARNSSLGHPNMAEASLGKNFPNVIPSLLHVFSGWYLQGLVI